MSIESGGYFGSNSAQEQPMPIPRYHLDRCEPVMDRDDADGEYCLWDDVQGEITHLETENKILKKALYQIADTPDGYEMEYCRDVAFRTLEELI
jgi:hypothetical protein